MLCWSCAWALLANIKTKGWFAFHRNFTLAKLCWLQRSYSLVHTNVSKGSGQEPSGEARKLITELKDKQEAHGEDNPKERDKNKHVALGRKQLAKINCIVVLLLSSFCCETGFVFVIEEWVIFQQRNPSWIGFMAEVHFMGRFEWRLSGFGSQDGRCCSRLKQKGQQEWKPWEESGRRKGRKRLEESWAGSEHAGAKTLIQN